LVVKRLFLEVASLISPFTRWRADSSDIEKGEKEALCQCEEKKENIEK
jgi:hypothetical protein